MLVTIAGLGGSIDGTFGGVLPLLADLDPQPMPLPGMGGEPRPGDVWGGTLPEVLDHLAAATQASGTFDLLGHSMGGSLAIAFAARWPQRVQRLIVAEPNLTPNRGILSGQIVRWREGAFVERGHATVVRAFDLAARRGEAQPDFATSIADSDPRLLHRAATWLRATDFAILATDLSMPRLFIGGGDADLATPAALGFEVISMPGTGHVMMRDDPARFAAIVREWLGDDTRPTSSRAERIDRLEASRRRIAFPVGAIHGMRACERSFASSK